jgi:hypothetical protein
MKKRLTKNEFYQAMGLFGLAQSHRQKCEEYEAALSEVLGIDADSMMFTYASDAIYNDGQLEAALKSMNVTIEGATSQRKDAETE